MLKIYWDSCAACCVRPKNAPRRMPQTHENVAFLLSQTAGGRSMLRPYSAHKHFFIGHFYFDTPSRRGDAQSIGGRRP